MNINIYEDYKIKFTGEYIRLSEENETIYDNIFVEDKIDKELKEEIRKYQVDRDKNTKLFINLNDYIKEEIKYCKEIGFECCVEELEKVLKEVE